MAGILHFPGAANMNATCTRLAGALFFLLTVAAAAPAQETDNYGSGFEFEAYGGAMDGDEPTLSPNEQQFRVSADGFFGGRVAYNHPSHVFFEGALGYAPLTLLSTASPDMGLNALVGTSSIGYNVQVARDFQFFLVAGGGIIRWDPDDPIQSETDGTAHYGGGVKIFFTRNVALRADIRDHLTFNALTDIRRQLNPGLTIEDGTTHNVEFTVGVSLFTGQRKDSDRDGVADARDRCPGTPRAAAVDANGCPLDGDHDGVPDYRDRCPDTPAGATVDSDGCPDDGDGDGVYNGLDKCPGTPANATVDADGCPSDTDRDGVFNGIDQCPDTPAGVDVDAKGCPLDSDGDGVFDGPDRCPDTPAGAEVDAYGCTVIEAGLEAGRLVLQNVYFDTNRAVIRPESEAILAELADEISGRPEIQLEVQGHTDSTGSRAYNRQLSQQRAESVVNFLIEHGVPAGRLTARGYGEGSPIASNDTPEGRQQNRRVEFIVTGG